MKEQIVFHAIQEMEKATGLQARWYDDTRDETLDGQIELKNGVDTYRISAICKKEIKSVNLVALQAQKEHVERLLVLAETIFPAIKENLRKLGINYIDGAGNCYIRIMNWYIFIDGLKVPSFKPVVKEKAFTRTALILIFHFLNEESYLNATYRQIAEDYNIALGNVNKIFTALREQGFILKTGDKSFKLVNRRKLLEEWVVGYDTKLKPSLFMGEFRFTNMLVKDWAKIPLGIHNLWGGEPAADIITGYLKPAELTLYTNEKRIDLIKKYKLAPGKGNFLVYSQFWQFKNKRPDVVPEILVYADLVNTGDARNIETARKLYDGLFKE